MTSIASALVNYTPKGSTMDDINASGNNTIMGGDGDDVIISFGGNCKIDAGAGNDQVGHVGDNTDIKMGDGEDQLVFWADNSNIDLGAGNDSAISLDLQCGVEGLDAPSFIDTDTNSKSSSSTSNSTSTSKAGDWLTTTNTSTTSTTINTYANDGIHNTTITGGDGEDSIMLRGTGNTIDGGAGNDTIASLSMLLGSSTSSTSSSTSSQEYVGTPATPAPAATQASAPASNTQASGWNGMISADFFRTNSTLSATKDHQATASLGLTFTNNRLANKANILSALTGVTRQQAARVVSNSVPLAVKTARTNAATRNFAGW